MNQVPPAAVPLTAELQRWACRDAAGLESRAFTGIVEARVGCQRATSSDSSRVGHREAQIHPRPSLTAERMRSTGSCGVARQACSFGGAPRARVLADSRWFPPGSPCFGARTRQHVRSPSVDPGVHFHARNGRLRVLVRNAQQFAAADRGAAIMKSLNKSTPRGAAKLATRQRPRGG